MEETKITKSRIKNHFTYSWWKYVLLAVLAIVGWNLIYTSTAYRAPKDKRLDIYFVTYSVPDEILNGMRIDILNRYPQLEDSSVISIVYTADDNYYGSMQLTTYMGAGEGDIYIMPKERFDAFAGSGTFVPLDEAVASGALDLQGMDVSRGYATDEDGTRALYGIPATELYGMMEEYGLDNRDLMICVMAYTRNEAVAVQWVNDFIGEMLAPKPEWLVEYEAQNGTGTQEVSDIPSY